MSTKEGHLIVLNKEAKAQGAAMFAIAYVDSFWSTVYFLDINGLVISERDKLDTTCTSEVLDCYPPFWEELYVFEVDMDGKREEPELLSNDVVFKDDPRDEDSGMGFGLYDETSYPYDVPSDNYAGKGATADGMVPNRAFVGNKAMGIDLTAYAIAPRLSKDKKKKKE